MPAIPGLEPDAALTGHWGFWYACVACWAVFSIYWEVAAKNTAPAKTSETKASRAVHVLLVNVAMMLVLAPVRGLGRLWPVSSAVMAAGLALVVAGVLLAVWARQHLGRNWSGEITIKVDHQLIRSGPYGLLRHPIYTGLLVMYAGAALVTGERLAAAGLALVLFAYWRKIRLEERNLAEAFGSEYEAYRRESWALVPGLF
jgi:protein-S-isoprenylcysteine O-methyltransferase Ste14